MNGFSFIMLLFSILIFMAGLYIYKGHNSKILLWKGYNKDTTKRELEQIGKWTIILSIIPFFLFIIGLFLDI